MGEVWRGRHEELRTEVAIKIAFIDHEGVDNERIYERFRFEAQTSAQLSKHTPHIVGVHDAGWAGQSPFLVMDLVAGDDAERLSDEGWEPDGWLRLPSALPQRWGLQVAIDDGETLRVERPDVSAEGRAEVLLEDIPPEASVTLLVSGLTPKTRRTPAYELRLN